MHLSLISLSYLTSASLVLARNLPRSFHGYVDHSYGVGSPGWSVQAATCPANTATCGAGSGACCPTGMYCATPANSEVAACCTSPGACRSVIEAAPRCADSSWNLWNGLDGNAFCCEVGMLGAYDHISHRAGTCVSSVVSPTTSAVLKSTGTGSKATTAVSVTSCTSAVSSASATSIYSAPSYTKSSISTTSTSIAVVDTVGTSASSVVVSAASPAKTGKPLGGVSDAQAEQDIKDAAALGVDAFAVNLQDITSSWATNAIKYLFKHADSYNFKLLPSFSFDMTAFNSPDQFITLLKSYVTNDAYYTYDGLPFVSTFNGGTSAFKFGQSSTSLGWKVKLQDVMATAGHPIYFIPSFQDVSASTNFFTSEYPYLNGTFNWDSWPKTTDGDIPVSTTTDLIYQTAAHSSSKTFMMGISPLQFKHIDSSQNWYRRGEQNLELRFGQVLALQPDFLEFQTWNDAGEGHYMGNVWWETLVSNTSAMALSSLSYDHTGYWQILGSFIKEWKAGATSTASMYPTNGAKAQGTFWHHTLLKNADCSSDSLGLPKPDGWQHVEDKVTAVVLVASGETGLEASIEVGGTVMGTQKLSAGYNVVSVANITTGAVSMKVTEGSGSVVVQGTGSLKVVDSAGLCNYNFQVVGLE
ncbi:glucan endo-1,3-alpha-glucosidase agn1 protein [Rutstroemia sp. NJR-2017a WRK4]|nr:glucan endo-1,3-alpha-glucosidase agn1 protein [Rutstroemia sp. NJR-2017a WRK4]